MAFADTVPLILGWLTLGGISLCLWIKHHLFFGKRPKNKEKPEVHETEEDYFRQLPDDILSSILALLTIKEAVRTSVLSRRWRYLFASRLSLVLRCFDMFGDGNFDNHGCCLIYQQKFLKVAKQFMQLYSGRKLAQLEMRFCIGKESASEFDQLIDSISRLGVEKLGLLFNCGLILKYNPDPTKLFKFSLELLSQASSLKHLHLGSCDIQPSPKVPLNSLRTLHLSALLLVRGQLELILSSCLNLEHLKLERCWLPDKLCISGTVTSVVFTFCEGLEEIDLQATNLHLFECSFDRIVRFYFTYVPVLEHVMIGLRGDAAMPYIFGGFARDLPAHVKSLIVKAFMDEVKYFPAETQIFRNLRKLALILTFTNDFDIVKLSRILDACPLLQYLDLEQDRTRRQARGSGKRFSLSPTYQTELKEVTIGGFHQTGEEIEFAIFILRSAMVLERMFLYPRFKHYLGCGIWKNRLPAYTPDWESERESIQRELHGKAISRNAVVIVE